MLLGGLTPAFLAIGRPSRPGSLDVRWQQIAGKIVSVNAS